MTKILNKTTLVIILITLFAGILRFFRLSDTPPALNWDEISHGYNAFSILKTGKDEWGAFLPAIFRAYGDYKLPVYIYLTTLPITLFGLNAFAVRFISALAGTLAIPGIYLLAKEITKKQTIGLAAAFLLAITPWHFFISRPALEANLCLTFLIFAFYFSQKGLSHSVNWIPASILWGLSLHTYNTARIFVPVFLACFILINKKTILPLIRGRHRGGVYISALILFISVMPIIFQTFSGTGLARYDKLSIINPDTVHQIGLARLGSTLPAPLPRLLHNRPVYFISTVSKNYLAYFSPQFLYQTKDAQAQFAIPGVNLLSLPLTTLFLLGLGFSLRHWKTHTSLYLWLLTSPLAAALTNSPPQALRPMPMLLAIVIFAALGLFNLIQIPRYQISRVVLAVGLVIFCLYSFSHYLNLYFDYYRPNYAQSWQYGYQQLFDHLSTLDPQKPIIITKASGEPHEFYAFYSQLDPRKLQDPGNTIRFYQSKWWWTDRIGSVYFVNDWEIPTTATSSVRLESKSEVSLKDAYLVTTGTRFPANFVPTKVIDGLQNDIVFIVGHIK